MRTAEWKLAQVAERRAVRAEARIRTAQRRAHRELSRRLRLRDAIERHRLVVTNYPHLRDEADAALWRLTDGS